MSNIITPALDSDNNIKVIEEKIAIYFNRSESLGKIIDSANNA